MNGPDGSNGNPRQDTISPFAPPESEFGQVVPDVTLGGSPFPPIADYGFLSDCETLALVAPSGNVEWMCLPRVDSPSIFGALLDRDAGSFRLDVPKRVGNSRLRARTQRLIAEVARIRGQ